MFEKSKQPWIEIGYGIFSSQGPNGLKIDVMAKKLNKSKSSFYHHFADIDGFIDCLQQYHLFKSVRVAAQAKLCQNIMPDIINLLIDIKQDLLFNRQLRINRHIPRYKECFDKAQKTVERGFIKIWSEAIGLDENLAQVVLNLVAENFYLQITEETLTYNWLSGYFLEILMMLRSLSKNV